MYNLMTAQDIGEHIVEVNKMKDPIALMFLGPPGIGKSFSIKAAAKKLKRNYTVVSLSRLEQFDIKGFPNIQGKYVKWIPPELIETIEESKGNLIVHIEEFTLARREVQDAILDLIQFKRVDDRTLPGNTMFILTGNKGDDGTAARAISSAITGGRAEVYEVVPPTLKQYLDYEVDLDHILKSFLLKNGIGVILQEPSRESTSKPWSCPRSFSQLNRIVLELKLDLMEGKDVAKCLRHAGGLLSENTILKLEDFFGDDVLSIDKLLSGNQSEWEQYKEAEVFKRSEALRSLSMALIHEMSEMLRDSKAEETREELTTRLKAIVSYVWKYETDKEIRYAFIFSIVEQDPEISEAIKVEGQTLSEIYEEAISKRYSKRNKD